MTPGFKDGEMGRTMNLPLDKRETFGKSRFREETKPWLGDICPGYILDLNMKR